MLRARHAGPKSFAAMDVARPDRNYYVRPPELDGLCTLLQDEQYVVVCGGRQTGKTTLAHALAKELQARSNVRVFYVQFSRTTVEKMVRSSYMHLVA